VERVKERKTERKEGRTMDRETEELLAKLVKPTTAVELLAEIIFTAAKVEERENAIAARDLKQSEIPAKRECKRKRAHTKVWRGEEYTADPVKAIYQEISPYMMAKVAPKGTKFTDSPENNGSSIGWRAC
jgi:hypothetical protein